MRNSRKPRFTWRIFTFALTAVLALATGVEAADLELNQASGVPAKVTAGEWDGTWYYVSRDYRAALWIRTVNGKPEHRIQIMSLFAPEGFITDWGGRTEYTTRNAPGLFHLRIDEADANEMRGTWLWDLQFRNSGRTEKSDVVLYRAGMGRTIVMKFDNVERTLRRGTRAQTANAPRAWTFLKGSNRLVLWDELPF